MHRANVLVEESREPCKVPTPANSPTAMRQSLWRLAEDRKCALQQRESEEELLKV